MVKRMTFNHSHKGSSPLGLKKKGFRCLTTVFFDVIILLPSNKLV